MKLGEIVCSRAILPKLTASDRDGAIKEMVESLVKSAKLDGIDPKKLAAAVIQRENEASTGIGKGVAVPHVKDETITDPVAAVACCSTGLDFSSLDKQPVYSIILLLSPAENPDKHLQAMETVFKSLNQNDFRRFLRQARTRKDIQEAIQDADQH